MGSPNFYTGFKGESFGADDSLMKEFAQRYADFGAEELDGIDTSCEMQELRDEALKLIEEANDKLLFSKITLRHGYHDGFQIMLDNNMPDLDDIEVEVEWAEPYVDYTQEQAQELMYIMDENGYKITPLDCPEMYRFGKVTIEKTNHEREQNISVLTVDDTARWALNDFVENDYHKALHHIAGIADTLDLRAVVGVTWTSGLTRDTEYNRQVIEQNYQPELFNDDYNLVSEPSELRPAPRA